MKPHDLHLLKLFDALPGSAVLPVAVAAAVKGVSDKTIRRTYRLIPGSADRRVGVRKRDLVDVEAA